MPQLAPGVDSEIPGVSDSLPKEIAQAQKGAFKLTLDQKLKNIPDAEDGFSAMRIAERTTKALVKLGSPIEYFSIFFSPDWFETFAQYTNINAAKKQEISEQEDFQEARLWTKAVTGPEIGVFIGALLLMGLEYRGELPLYWAQYGDVQGTEEIIKVIANLHYYQINRLTNQ